MNVCLIIIISVTEKKYLLIRFQLAIGIAMYANAEAIRKYPGMLIFQGSENVKICSRDIKMSRKGAKYHRELYPNRGMRNKHHSSETKAKISSSEKGKVVQKETIEKLKISHLGKLESKETRIRKSISARNRPQISEETRNKMRKPKSAEAVKKTSEGLRKAILDGRIVINNKNTFAGAGFRDDLGFFVRSRWEANTVRILKLMNKNFEYESRNCRFKTSLGILILDFYLPDDNLWLEVKGYLYQKSKDKMNDYMNTYPNEAKNTFIIDGESYNKLSEKFRRKIPCWES
jgi:hypothetical protein